MTSLSWRHNEFDHFQNPLSNVVFTFQHILRTFGIGRLHGQKWWLGVEDGFFIIFIVSHYLSIITIHTIEFLFEYSCIDARDGGDRGTGGGTCLFACKRRWLLLAVCVAQ